MLSTFLSRKRLIAILIGAVALLASGCMWGVVRDAQTGRPLAGASVSYVDANGNTGSTTTDGNGLFAFDQSRGPVPARGPVTFQVNAAGYHPFTESRQVEYNDGPRPMLSNLSSFWEVQSFGLTASGPSSYDGQPTLGPANARVVMVEFADFQCPYCARFAHDTLPQIIADYGDKVLFVFRNLPLPMHPDAFKAAEAGECAFQQGAFWQYHDMLFANQGALGVDSLKRYAVATGLDVTAFDECLDSGATASAVDADIAAGYQAAADAGLTQFGTPAFFINGRPIIGAYPYDEFKRVIDEELAKAGQ
jgi:protein-disulfide isomerase